MTTSKEKLKVLEKEINKIGEIVSQCLEELEDRTFEDIIFASTDVDGKNIQRCSFCGNKITKEHSREHSKSCIVYQTNLLKKYISDYNDLFSFYSQKNKKIQDVEEKYNDIQYGSCYKCFWREGKLCYYDKKSFKRDSSGRSDKTADCICMMFPLGTDGLCPKKLF